MYDKKLHYKMYKAGKNWVFAGITTLALAAGFMLGAPRFAQADTVSTSVKTEQTAASNQVKTASQQNNADQTAVKQDAQKTADAAKNTKQLATAAQNTKKADQTQTSQEKTEQNKTSQTANDQAKNDQKQTVQNQAQEAKETAKSNTDASKQDQKQPAAANSQKQTAAVKKTTAKTAAKPAAKAVSKPVAKPAASKTATKAEVKVQPKAAVKPAVKKAAPIPRAKKARSYYKIRKIRGKKYLINRRTGRKVRGEYKVGKYTYYFDKKSGAMKTGFQKVGAYKKYYNKYGHRLNGQHKIGKYIYYFATKQDGVMRHGWATFTEKINKSGTKKAKGTYYYTKLGHKLFGSHKVANDWYFFNKQTGAIEHGFAVDTDYHRISYYDPKTGKRQTGTVTLKDKSGSQLNYHFDKNGALTMVTTPEGEDEAQYNLPYSYDTASMNNVNGYIQWNGWFRPKGYHQYQTKTNTWKWVNSGVTDWRPYMMYAWPSRDIEAQYIKYFVNNGYADASLGLTANKVKSLTGKTAVASLNSYARKVRDSIEKQIVKSNYSTAGLANTLTGFMATVPSLNYHSELPVEDVKGYVPANSGTIDDDQILFINNNSKDQKKGNTANADSKWRLLNRTILNQDGKHTANLSPELLVGNDIDNSNPVVQAEQINWEYYLLNYGTITGQGSDANFDGFRNDAADNIDADVLDQQAQLLNDLYGLKSSEANSLNHLAYNEGYHVDGATMLKNKNYQQLYMDSGMFYALHSNLGRNQGNLAGINGAGIVKRLSDSANVTGNSDTSIIPNWSFVNNHDQQKNIINQWIINQHPGVTDIMAAGYKAQYAVDAWNAFYADEQKVNKQFTQMNVPAQYAILLTNKDTIPTVYYGDLYNETRSYMTSKSIYYNAITNLLKARRKYVAGGQTMATPSTDKNLLISVRLGKGVKDINSTSNDPLARTTGMVVVVSNKSSMPQQFVKINVGKEHAGQKFINIMDTTKSTADGDMSGLAVNGNHSKDVTADANGYITVEVQGYANPLVNGYLGVWVPDGAAADQVASTAASTANRTNGKSYVSDAASDSKVLYEDFSLFQPMEKTASDRAYTKIAANAQNFADLGITDFWMAPPYTPFGMSRYNEGYSLNDRYTLGTDANPTKYGSGAQLAAALKAIHKAGMHAQVDLVMNQMIGLSGQEPVTVRRASAYGNLKKVNGKTYDNLVYMAYTKGGGDGQKTYGGKFLAQLKKDHPDLFTTKAISTGVAPDPSTKIQEWSAKYYNGSSLQNIGTGLVMKDASGKYAYLATNGNNALPWSLPAAFSSASYWETGALDEPGWMTIQGKKYYFNANGKLASGNTTINGKQYYFNPKDNSLAVGLTTIGKNTYLFDKNNQMLKGFQRFTNNGVKQTSYFSKKNGAMLKSFRKIKLNGKWNRYYFSKKNGAMLTSLRKIKTNGKWYRYYFSRKNGVMLTGFRTLTINGKKYKVYLSKKTGRMLTGWRKIKVNGKWHRYYFSKKTGSKMIGWHRINGRRHYFSKSGILIR